MVALSETENGDTEMALAVDWLSRCHNANRGTYGHECGKPAQWLAEGISKHDPSGFYTTSFCDRCKREGDERHGMMNWRKAA
jgi:hypothetical protein